MCFRLSLKSKKIQLCFAIFAVCAHYPSIPEVGRFYSYHKISSKRNRAETVHLLRPLINELKQLNVAPNLLISEVSFVFVIFTMNSSHLCYDFYLYFSEKHFGFVIA